jgi:hypothetical protein
MIKQRISIVKTKKPRIVITVRRVFDPGLLNETQQTSGQDRPRANASN